MSLINNITQKQQIQNFEASNKGIVFPKLICGYITPKHTKYQTKQLSFQS